MIPLAGNAVTAAKFANKADLAITALKASDEVAAGAKGVKGKGGVYEFKYKDKDGNVLDYTGQSKDMDKRVKQHSKNKEIVPGTEKKTSVDGDKTDREIVETKTLDAKGGTNKTNPNSGNQRRPVSEEREKKLRQSGKWQD
jgi:hypothetical protein